MKEADIQVGAHIIVSYSVCALELMMIVSTVAFCATVFAGHTKVSDSPDAATWALESYGGDAKKKSSLRTPPAVKASLLEGLTCGLDEVLLFS
ncbi:hypothetical protein SARC_09200 [Sphaeroforma arctica JP610]|uniref:Uncharacterized protein n=1 Tax=Sphaeroforma arctica JP610 TaxID=667725 RepID=A0A0L0FPC2_9EUKA|nr:hypothetical protein SARC_09200 [Sphaeroforma arctica JP610]KNC78366.1 hypothetical protein SARC_09200 [Sphaeroforma arctica JP610]|eukprot:XP_014152268.1 hypothetical protein SARC_09200 [Sphaeroforma arctica JP610]